jgi:hypothetical protein
MVTNIQLCMKVVKLSGDRSQFSMLESSTLVAVDCSEDGCGSVQLIFSLSLNFVFLVYVTLLMIYV